MPKCDQLVTDRTLQHVAFFKNFTSKAKGMVLSRDAQVVS